jgi:hypothetical protein
VACKRYQKIIAGAAKGADDLSQHGELRSHVASCANCSAEWDRERFMVEVIDRKIAQALAAEPSENLLFRVRQSVAAADIPAVSWRSFMPDFRPRVWLAVAIVCMAVTGAWVWNGRRPATGPSHSTLENILAPLGERVSRPAAAEGQVRGSPDITIARNNGGHHTRKSVMRTPEAPHVLIEKDEAALVLQLYNAVRTGRVNPASLVTSLPGFRRAADGSLVPVPLRIQPIQIAALSPGPTPAKSGVRHQE